MKSDKSETTATPEEIAEIKSGGDLMNVIRKQIEKNEYSDLLNSDFSNPAFSNPEVVRKPLDKEQKKKALMTELASNIGIVATPEQMGLLFELYPGTKKLIKFGLLSQIAKQSAPGILSKFGVVNEIISDKELEIELEPEKEIFLTKKKRRFSKKYYR